MERAIRLSIPYRRQSFNPRVQAYLQSIEDALNREIDLTAQDREIDLAVQLLGAHVKSGSRVMA